jgi:hypothetical protein
MVDISNMALFFARVTDNLRGSCDEVIKELTLNHNILK